MRVAGHTVLQWGGFDALTPRDVHDILKLRQDVFVVEQACAYADIDGNDTRASHLLARANSTGELAGSVRMFTDLEPGHSRIGRVVVAKTWRGTGLGQRMMEAAIARALELEPEQDILLTAQAHLEKFYHALGFQTVSEPFPQDGIPHIDMMLRAVMTA